MKKKKEFLKLIIRTLIVRQIIVERVVQASHHRLRIVAISVNSCHDLLFDCSITVTHLEEHVADNTREYDEYVDIDFDTSLEKDGQHRAENETECFEQNRSRVSARIVRKKHAKYGTYLCRRQTIGKAKRDRHQKYDVDARRVVRCPRDHEDTVSQTDEKHHYHSGL